MITMQSRLHPIHPAGPITPCRYSFTDFMEVWHSMKISDLIIDPKSLGSKLWLVEVSPAYEYKDNHRTDTITGYRYTIALPEKGLDKITVKIDGEQRMETPDGYAEVRFDGLEVFLYWSRGDYTVGARATGIHPVNPKA